jgi:hypothetical protein
VRHRFLIALALVISGAQMAAAEAGELHGELDDVRNIILGFGPSSDDSDVPATS